MRSETWARLFWRFITYRPMLDVAGAVVVFASATAEIAFPWLLQRGVDAATGWDDSWSLEAASLAMVGVIVAIVLFHAIALLIETWLFSGASFELRRRLYAHFQQLPLAELSRHRSGTLTHRGTSDVAAFESGVTELFSNLLFDVLVAFGVGIAMALIDLRMTGVVIAVMVVATVVTNHFGRPLPVFARATQILAARLAGRLQESLGAARTVRAFGAEGREVSRLDAINRRILTMERQAGVRRAMVTPLWHFAEALGLIAVLWYGGHLVAAKVISVGAMVGFIAYMELLAGPITRIGGYYAQFQFCRGLAERIADLLRTGTAVLPSGTQRGRGVDIAFDRVAFRYPGTQRRVLHDVSFTIREGEHVALMGRNGAGKSTLFDLLLRFYAPDEGTVVVGGVDLGAWDNAAWRETVGFMAQETVLFQGTLAENVAYGRPDASRGAITAALADAGAGALLARLPRGLDTLVGERGTGLSGGERQVVGLARLFLRDPRIVLLDEPTSALDGEALRTVDAALERLTRGRTALLITHSTRTLRLAERIVLLDEGRVVASGTPEELAATQPLYRSLVGSAGELSPA